mgnify:FL=1
MRKLGLFVLSLILCGAFDMKAQVIEEPEENLDGFYVKSSDAYPDGKKPFEYPYVREADIIWSCRIWRVIDFKEKMNQVFYYPIVPDQGRKNLTTILDEALTEGRIRAFEDDMFTTEITNWTEYKSKFGTSRTETLVEYDMDGMEITRDTTIFVPANFESAEKLRIKEEWFLDKNRTVEDVRIIGFSLVASYEKSEGDVQTLALGWIRYNDPEVRLLLANSEVYNPQNDRARRSYDDIFQKRIFDSYIIRESNTFNRAINDYVQGADALAESERIKEYLFNMEEDMWEY